MSLQPAVIDAETTGLDYKDDAILELAVCITDRDLNVVADFGSRVLSVPEEKLDRMNDYVREMHTANGLLEDVAKATMTLADLDEEISQFLIEQGFAHDDSPFFRELIMLGNSCRLDLNMIEFQMPKLSRFLHYRMLDMSGLEEIMGMWIPEAMSYSTEPYNNHPELPGHRAGADVARTLSQARSQRSALQNLRAPF